MTTENNKKKGKGGYALLKEKFAAKVAEVEKLTEEISSLNKEIGKLKRQALDLVADRDRFKSHAIESDKLFCKAVKQMGPIRRAIYGY